MADYISKEAVLSKCGDVWDSADETTQTGVAIINTIDKITDFIESLPAADVKPVKYSSWEYHTYPIVDSDGVVRRCMIGYVCKACGHGEPEEKRFCGGCGAEMWNE